MSKSPQAIASVIKGVVLVTNRRGISVMGGGLCARGLAQTGA
jgi:hypothetical protein